MKNLLLSVFAMLLISGVLGAQVNPIVQDLEFGVRAGMNYADLNGDGVGNADGRIGIMVGLFGEYQISQRFGLQVEALYSEQGLRRDNEILNVNYINLPFLVKFYVHNTGFVIDAGPQVGFLVADNYEDNEVDIDDLDTNPVELSVGGGVSYQFNYGTSLEGLSATLRYMRGLSNVYKSNIYVGEGITNSVVSLSIGYKF